MTHPAAMGPALTCTVICRYPVALLRVQGVLRLDTAAVLRSAALKVLADRPTAMVLDIAGLHVTDSAAATVLPLVEHHAASWADAALLLAAPSPSVREALRRLGSDLPLHDTRSAALTAAAARPVPARVRVAFAPDEAAPAKARRAVRRAGSDWVLPPGLGERAAQIANELVTNVVEHARTDGVLLVSMSRQFLHLSVRDGSATPPVLGRPSQTSGYGLPLVAELSSGWGSRTVPDGKVVWAILRIWPGPIEGTAFERRAP